MTTLCHWHTVPHTYFSRHQLQHWAAQASTSEVTWHVFPSMPGSAGALIQESSRGWLCWFQGSHSVLRCSLSVVRRLHVWEWALAKVVR